MLSFHGDAKIKEKYLNRVAAHIKADNLIRGTGWEGGKGCAVGCTLERYDHKRYEIELGIPEWLARLEDTLFEKMSLEKSKTWPQIFLESIPIGVDCEKARVPFIINILERNLRTLDACAFDEENSPDVVAAINKTKNAINQTIEAYRGNGDLAAESAAWSARSVAESAAESAAWSAESAESAESARSAAWSAASAAESAAWSAESAESAESAVWSAKSAAESAVWSAKSAAASAARSAASAARSAASAARSAAYDGMADELIEILRSLR